MEADNFSLSQELGQMLLSKGLKIATAESCTGGGLAYELTGVPGSSAWFECSVVAYSHEAKIKFLDVKSATLMQYGAVSEQVAMEMAEGMLTHSLADIAVSITGIAGPQGGSIEKPVGTVWLGLAGKMLITQTRHLLLTGSRREIRENTIRTVILWLLQELGKLE